MVQQENIRNFSIIAHIDHGKSTLADRILEITGTIPQREMRERYLDKMDLEQEKGVTIKLQPIRINYTLNTTSLTDRGQRYTLNLIDTPGHVDFSYEVSRSLAACEGAVLLVDLSQGVQAQTLAHYQKAKALSLTFIPVINKIDLGSPSLAEKQLMETLEFQREEIIYTSGKTGEGVKTLLKRIIEKIPPPKGNQTGPLRALVFDSFYDPHKGVVLLIRVMDGMISKENRTLPLQLMATNTEFVPLEIGYFKDTLTPQEQLSTGEVGYIATGIKEIRKCRVGDTVTSPTKGRHRLVAPLPGYKEIKPRVFAGIYPEDPKLHEDLKAALNRLSLNDAALTFFPENSPILGSGFRGGFLGQFHLEITRERLKREFKITTITTTPSVEYRAKLKTPQQVKLQGKHGLEPKIERTIRIRSAAELPEINLIIEMLEPWITMTIYTPYQYLGSVMQLCKNSRATLKNKQPLGKEKSLRLKLNYHMPLNELLDNFFGKLKSVSSGFASLDYEFLNYQKGDIVKLDIFINKEIIEPLSLLLPRHKAKHQGRIMVERLKEIVPRQQFSVPIQAAIGGKIIARTDLKALRKNVTAKLYGGDRTRKDKLLKQQKKGKKRLRKFGKVTLPHEVFKILGEN